MIGAVSPVPTMATIVALGSRRPIASALDALLPVLLGLLLTVTGAARLV